MAWEWSHTDEAYADAYENLHQQPLEWLIEAHTEWLAREKNGSFSRRLYSAAKARSSKLAEETLADAIWEHASAQRTCDNGGFNAWMCPFGCHKVTFDCIAD
jgi:hypothetical protein